MSHITRLIVQATQISDIDALVKALSDIGISNVEVLTTPRLLRSRAAGKKMVEVVIKRRRYRIFTDEIGFSRNQNGTFDLIAPSSDSTAWMNSLMQRYIYHVTRTKLEAQGFTLVTDEVQQGDRIHMVLRRTV